MMAATQRPSSRASMSSEARFLVYSRSGLRWGYLSTKFGLIAARMQTLSPGLALAKSKASWRLLMAYFFAPELTRKAALDAVYAARTMHAKIAKPTRMTRAGML